MKDYISAIGSLLLAIFVYASSASFADTGAGLDQDPAYYPRLLAVLLAVMSVILFVDIIRKKIKPEISVDKASLVNILKVFAILVAYLAAIHYTGFLVASVLFMPGCVLLFRGGPKLAFFAGVPLSVAVYFAFAVLLKVPLPKGVLFR